MELLFDLTEIICSESHRIEGLFRIPGVQDIAPNLWGYEYSVSWYHNSPLPVGYTKQMAISTRNNVVPYDMCT